MAEHYYYRIGDQLKGPVSGKELIRLAAENAITPETEITRRSDSKQFPARRLRRLWPSDSQSAEDAAGRVQRTRTRPANPPPTKSVPSEEHGTADGVATQPSPEAPKRKQNTALVIGIVVCLLVVVLIPIGTMLVNSKREEAARAQAAADLVAAAELRQQEAAQERRRKTDAFRAKCDEFDELLRNVREWSQDGSHDMDELSARYAHLLDSTYQLASEYGLEPYPFEQALAAIEDPEKDPRYRDVRRAHAEDEFGTWRWEKFKSFVSRFDGQTADRLHDLLYRCKGFFGYSIPGQTGGSRLGELVVANEGRWPVMVWLGPANQNPKPWVKPGEREEGYWLYAASHWMEGQQSEVETAHFVLFSQSMHFKHDDFRELHQLSDAAEQDYSLHICGPNYWLSVPVRALQKGFGYKVTFEVSDSTDIGDGLLICNNPFNASGIYVGSKSSFNKTLTESSIRDASALMGATIAEANPEYASQLSASLTEFSYPGDEHLPLMTNDVRRYLRKRRIEGILGSSLPLLAFDKTSVAPGVFVRGEEKRTPIGLGRRYKTLIIQFLRSNGEVFLPTELTDEIPEDAICSYVEIIEQEPTLIGNVVQQSVIVDNEPTYLHQWIASLTVFVNGEQALIDGWFLTSPKWAAYIGGRKDTKRQDKRRVARLGSMDSNYQALKEKEAREKKHEEWLAEREQKRQEREAKAAMKSTTPRRGTFKALITCPACLGDRRERNGVLDLIAGGPEFVECDSCKGHGTVYGVFYKGADPERDTPKTWNIRFD